MSNSGQAAGHSGQAQVFSSPQGRPVPREHQLLVKARSREASFQEKRATGKPGLKRVGQWLQRFSRRSIDIFCCLSRCPKANLKLFKLFKLFMKLVALLGLQGGLLGSQQPESPQKTVSIVSFQADRESSLQSQLRLARPRALCAAAFRAGQKGLILLAPDSQH